MRFALRAAAVAVLAALAAAVILFRPGSEPFATAAEPAADVDLALVPADAPLLPALEQIGWRPVYEDKTATLLVFGGT